MKKLTKLAMIIPATLACALSMTACEEVHVHKWSGYERTADEHVRVCTVEGCDAEERSAHNGTPCADCGSGMKVLAFGSTTTNDPAHNDFVVDANKWFPEQGEKLGFTYEYADTNWGLLTEENLENYDLIMLLNSRPGTSESQEVFKNYMDNGGACVIFHAAGFAMWFDDPNDPFTTSDAWEDWFSNTLMRSGVYGYCDRDPEEPINEGYYWNTWPPTSEPMKIETYDHFVTKDLECLGLKDDTFMSAPCEWYEWHNDLFADEETTVLVSMNPTPDDHAGNDTRGPNYEHQNWYAGHHAIAWANNNYNMVYMNWGHNLQSYNLKEGADRGESSTFESEVQNKITLEAMFGLVTNKK